MNAWEFITTIIKRLFQYIYRFILSLYHFFSHFDNLYDTGIQIITLMTIALWLNMTFFDEFVQKINGGAMNNKSVNSDFDSFKSLSSSLSNFQQYQAILIYLTALKLLIFFLMPKRTYMLIEMLLMASTYITFFMVLYFLVNNSKNVIFIKNFR